MIHWHEEFEIIHLVGGRAKFVVGNKSIEGGPGDNIIINTDTLHGLTVLDKSYRHLVIMVNKSFCAQNSILFDNYVYPVSVSDDELGTKIATIAREEKERGVFYKPLIRAEIIDLMVFLTRKYGTPRRLSLVNDRDTDQKLEYVKRAITFIRGNFRRQFSIDELCGAAAISKYYLCHLFKDMTSKTIVEYINMIRCEYAKEMLDSGKFNVTQSAKESGFQDNSYFSRTYKRYIGIFPSEEKKKISMAK